MTFYVLLTRERLPQQLIGPYRSFKRAAGDALAWDRIQGWECVVLEIRPMSIRKGFTYGLGWGLGRHVANFLWRLIIWGSVIVFVLYLVSLGA